ncbi:hypothetical protein Lal_00004053 [Lupinus albus]|nr:hypothetical protein Lal_00004053 [Lupinus albus]
MMADQEVNKSEVAELREQMTEMMNMILVMQEMKASTDNHSTSHMRQQTTKAYKRSSTPVHNAMEKEKEDMNKNTRSPNTVIKTHTSKPHTLIKLHIHTFPSHTIYPHNFQNTAQTQTQIHVPQQTQNNYQSINTNYAQRNRYFDPIPISYVELFDQLQDQGMLTPVEGKVFEPPYPKWYDPAASCAYHYNIAGHSIENCRDLKYKVQELIDSKLLDFRPAIEKR